MNKYKISASKNQKKYTIILKAEDLYTAKERIHMEWYSILGVEEFYHNDINWTKVVFEWDKNWVEKKAKIVWTDIFKIYTRLRKDLWYNITKIYFEEEPDKSEENLTKILNELNAEYRIYQDLNSKRNKKIKVTEDGEENSEIDSFYLKKELDNTHKLIEFVLLKIWKVLDNKEVTNLSPEQREKLKNVYNSIIKVKKTTNISKLREVWELALMKVWQIELKLLEETKSKEAKDFLWETNKLLKKIWSDKHFIDKSSDIWYKFKNKFSSFFWFFDWMFSWTKKQDLDKKSYSYVKNLLVIKKYKQRLRKNDKKMLKNILAMTFPFWDRSSIRDDILLERKVLKQNITLLNAKNKARTYSYTTIKKWYKKMFERLIWVFDFSKKYLFFTMLFYSIFLIIYIPFSFYFTELQFWIDAVFLALILVIIYLYLLGSRTIFTILFNFTLLQFLLLFSLINF